jgi:hypothetical protein
MLILTRRVGETLMIGDNVDDHGAGRQGQPGTARCQRAEGRDRASRGDLPAHPEHEERRLARALNANPAVATVAAPVFRRDGRVAEGAPLLRAYRLIPYRGFESLSLRQISMQSDENTGFLFWNARVPARFPAKQYRIQRFVEVTRPGLPTIFYFTSHAGRT